jgi:hypothetical protein
MWLEKKHTKRWAEEVLKEKTKEAVKSFSVVHLTPCPPAKVE